MDDWIINDELNLRVSHLVSGAAASAMVLGGVIPYVPQYRQIKQTQDADGFSFLVCLTLLIANTLRILFWFYSRFELPLLVQSMVMNVTMFLMIHLCVSVRRNNSILKGRERVFTDITQVDIATNCVPDRASNLTARIKDDIRTENTTPIEERKKRRRDPNKHYISDFDLSYFWAWTDFQSYLDFMLAVWFIGAIITYFLLPYKVIMETVGFLAVFIEAMLGAPQFLRNFKNKSTQGMSIMMVALWTVGDIFKTCYFVFRNAPTQFWICGSLQVSLDLAILFQVFLYSKNTKTRDSHRGDYQFAPHQAQAVAAEPSPNQSSSNAVDDAVIHISLHPTDIDDKRSDGNLSRLQTNPNDNVSQTSRKSSLSLAQPIPMPDDCREIKPDSDSHKIEMVDHTNCNGDVNDSTRHSDDQDGNVKTAL